MRLVSGARYIKTFFLTSITSKLKTFKIFINHIVFIIIKKSIMVVRNMPLLFSVIRNISILLIMWFSPHKTQFSCSSMFLNKADTELCAPYSKWIEKTLRKRIDNHGFSASTFIALCSALPGRYILDIFKRFQSEILNNENCFKVVIRRGLERSLIHDQSDATFTNLETYHWTINYVLDAFKTGKYNNYYNYIKWYLATPHLVGGEIQRSIAVMYRELESLINPQILPPYFKSKPTAGIIRVGLFRHDYKDQAETHLLPALISELPPNIKFIFLGFGDKPNAPIDNFDYVKLTNTNIEEATIEARNLNLDVAIFSPPIWGSFCTPMTRMIENRIATTQIFYLGDISTSGLKNLDYFLFPKELPVEKYQTSFTENLFPVKWGIAPVPPLFSKIDKSKVYNKDHKTITFVTNCHVGKINDTLISAWADILLLVPNSNILLFPFASADHEYSRNVLDHFIRNKCKSMNLDPKRFIICNSSGPSKIHEFLSQSQVYLDSFPYSGCISTAEAICAELPSVCLVGEYYHTQLCRMVAEMVDLKDEMLVYDIPSYIKRAASLGNNAILRQQVKDVMHHKISLLCKDKMDREFSKDFWSKVLDIIKLQIKPEMLSISETV